MSTTVKQEVSYRLGLDLGSNSIGWTAVRLDNDREPCGILAMGVRVFPDGRDPQSKASNAGTRRSARGARRQHRRSRQRRNKFLSLLIEHGLMPRDEAIRKGLERRDPYRLRAKALNEELPAHHVGRALLHLNQRRGFQSNRKTEQTKQSASETGVIKDAAKRLDEQMNALGTHTLGEFLYRHRRQGQRVRFRNEGTPGGKAEYKFYPTREMLLDEFDKIWDAQEPHHKTIMTAEAKQALRATIADQLPLRPQPVGKCTLDPARDKDDLDGFRCPWAHPLAQRFRIWQEVRNLEVEETGQQSKRLSKEEGDKVARALLQQNTVSFNRIRKLLDLPPDMSFNLESAKRAKLLGDQTAAKLSHKNFFGPAWRKLPLDRQIEIVEQLLDDTRDDNTVVAWLTQRARLDHEGARRTVSALLPAGHCRLGLRAIENTLRRMEAGQNYPDAAMAAGYDHAQLPTGELSLTGRLPYYGEWLKDHLSGTGDPRDPNEKRWGRYPNPTVHIGLGQVRRVLNALIDEYGRPSQVVVEMTRDFKLSPRRLAELEKQQAENQKQNEQREKQLVELGLDPSDYDNRLKLRLWEELNPKNALGRRCPFTGEQIGPRRLFSDEVEVEHLIPRSVSLDDSPANKVVSLRSANRQKGKRTPHEAFGDTPEWENIVRRADTLPKNKRWRFAENARQHFEGQSGFLARQLSETGWLARIVKQYISAIINPNNIWVVPGRLTGDLRHRWGLNKLLPSPYARDVKKRTDHRHHAIDALVVALTDRSLLHRMSSAYDEQRSRVKIPPPWESLRSDLMTYLDEMAVSHKPEHGRQDRLHEDFSYGTVRRPDLEGGRNLVYRKAFRDLTKAEVGRIRDVRLQDLVQAHIESEEAKGEDLKAALRSFSIRTDIPGLPKGIRHVRLLKSENPDSLVSIVGRNRTAYIPGENAFVDILETPEGKWVGEAVSYFQANQGDYQPRWMSVSQDTRFVMRLFKGDLLALHDDGRHTVMRVHRLEPSANRLRLAPHNETGNLDERHKDPEDPFRWRIWAYNSLRSREAERVRVDPLGRIWRVSPEEIERVLRARAGREAPQVL